MIRFEKRGRRAGAAILAGIASVALLAGCGMSGGGGGDGDGASTELTVAWGS